jgi:hypothetical protein
VNLAGVDHDYVASAGFDLSYSTPGALCATIDDPDAELIVRVPGKVMIGSEAHELDATEGRSMQHYMMDSLDHFAFYADLSFLHVF